MLRGDPINIYKYLNGESKEDQGRCFSVPTDKTKGSRSKLKCRRYHLNIRKCFFIAVVTEHWQRLRREIVESPM